MKTRYNIVLLIVILIGFMSAVVLNITRHRVEQQNTTVEMAMEYEGLRKIAAMTGLPEDDVLRKFQDAGINTLMIFDTTLERLSKHGEILTASGGELRQASILGADKGVFAAVPQNEIEENAVYITQGNNPDIMDQLADDLAMRYEANRYREVSSSPRIFKLLGNPNPLPEGVYDEPQGLMQQPLGLPVRDMRHVEAMGFNIIVRPYNYLNVNEEKIDSIFKRIDLSGVKVSGVMPTGTEVVGYPNKIDYMGKKLQERQYKLVMLEHYTQLQFAKIEGLVPLAEANDYNAVRSYVIDGTEQKKITVGTALARWALTDEERNIRVNYIRPFLMPVEGKDILTTNLQYVKDIKASVEARGYKIGKAEAFNGVYAGALNWSGKTDYTPYMPAKVLFIPVVLGILAGVVLFAGLLLNLKHSYEIVLWAGLSVTSLALLFIGRGLLLRQLLALAAASVFPVLAMNTIFDIWDGNKRTDHSLISICLKAIWQLGLAIVLSLIGAHFLSGILTDSRFLLEIDIYRGVKLTFMLPVILTAILYMKRYDLLSVAGKGMRMLWTRVNGLLDTGLTFRHVAVLLVLAFIAFYFVGRSGHTGGVPVPAIELKMRAFLEQLMYARPREKEFMIGHPMFFLAVLAVYRGLPQWCRFALVCAGVIGQGSLVQTFCHMRTPFIMSFARALDGYAVGVVFGVIGILICGGILLPLYNKYIDTNRKGDTSGNE